MDKNFKEVINGLDNAIKQKSLEILALRNLKNLILQNKAMYESKTEKEGKKA